MTLKLLDSGYWLARWNDNQFVQWPKWDVPKPEHGFGWLTPRHFEEAERAVAELWARREP